MKTKKTDEIRRKIVLFFMSFTLCLLQSCSTEEVVLESESNSKTRDYSVKKISFLDLKNINNQVFIESAKLKKVFSIDKNKTVNSISNYDIDLQNIQYLKRTNNDETFSFRIYQVPTATFLQNIVVECKEKSKPQTYLVTYYLNKQANQINNSNDFIRAIKSTSIIKIENQFKTHRTTSGGCLQVGYYEEVDACEGELDTRPRCYNSDGTRATINVFKVIDSACSTGAGPTDFIPMAAQWNFYNTAPSNPNYQNTGSGTGTGTNSGGETIDINIFAPNYFEGGDLSDPAVQNRLRVNQFMTTLYNSSNEIKNVVDTTEWLMPYTNYWIGSNGGLTPSNQNTMTFAFNAIPTLFNQYYGTTYEPSQIANFKFSVFQFLLFHGGFLSNLDPITQKSILDGLTSFEQIEQINTIVNYMTQNPGVTLANTKNLLIAQAIEDKIDDSALDPCPKGIMEKLKNTENKDIAFVINKLEANSIYTVDMKMGSTAQGYAQTQKISTNNYLITVANDSYTSSTQLFRAASLIHEIIHAYYHSVVDDNKNPTTTPLNNFPALYQAYELKKYPGGATVAQHDQMAKDYVDAIALALQEYYINNQPLLFPLASYEVFTDLAWGTLQEASIFNEKYKDGDPVKERILNRYRTESTGQSVESGTTKQQNPVGKPCN